jgi:hypothetical protein
MHKPTSKMNTTSSTWFFFTIVYLIIDYARPQDILPIGFLRPGMISIVILTLFLLFAHKLHYARSTQTTLMLLFVGLLVLFVPFARNNYYAFHTALGMVLYLPFIASTIIV